MTDQLLPKVAHELAEVIGMSGTLRLIEMRGGTKFKVPKNPADDHWLRGCLRSKELLKLIETYSGEEIDLPVLHAKRRALVWADIEQRREQGETVGSVALRHGMTERGVYKASARNRDKRQGEMDV